MSATLGTHHTPTTPTTSLAVTKAKSTTVRETTKGRPRKVWPGGLVNFRSQECGSPSQPKPVTGDMQRGPSSTITNNAVANISHVSSQVPNDNLVSVYSTRKSESDAVMHPFIHPVELKGEKKTSVKIAGLFNDGALVNSICKAVYPSLRGKLGNLTPSTKTLRMANGTNVPSSGRWFSDVSLGGRTLKAWFEVFPSGGGWSLLVGKPLLEKFKAVHDYERDVLMIPSNGEWTTLTNKAYNGDSNISLRGNDDSPLRQVSSSILNNKVPFDKLHTPEPLLKTACIIHELLEGVVKRRQGRRA
jgi:hypothetical protein